MFAVLTMVHTAETTKEQLDTTPKPCLLRQESTLSVCGAEISQMDGLNTASALWRPQIDAPAYPYYESLCGVYPVPCAGNRTTKTVRGYGQNAPVKICLIIANRRHLLNGNSFILGVSGAESFTAKRGNDEHHSHRPYPADVIIIDPEREYSALVKGVGRGHSYWLQAKTISTLWYELESRSTVQTSAIPKSSDLRPLRAAYRRQQSWAAKQKFIIDRCCTASVYRHYQQGNYQERRRPCRTSVRRAVKAERARSKGNRFAIELFYGRLSSIPLRSACTNVVDNHSRLYLLWHFRWLGKAGVT